MFTPAGRDRLSQIKDFNLSSLHDGINGTNLSILVRSWVSLLLDSPSSRQKSPRLIHDTLKKMSKNLPEYIRKHSALADKLANSVVTDDFGDFVVSLHDDFRKEPVFAEYCEWFRSGDAALFAWIFSFLLFGKKSEYVDEELIPASLRKWRKNEDTLGHRGLPAHIVADLRETVALTGIKLDKKQFYPGFGPGTVSERKIRKFSQKCADLRYDPGLESALRYILGDDYDILLHRYVIDVAAWEKGKAEHELASIDYSEQLFVAKDVNSVRTIFREPNAKMYGQQGVRAMLEDAITRSPYAQLTTIRDQGKNQQSCFLAAEDGEYVTIDLSAASDMVGQDLVLQIFDDDFLVPIFGTKTNLSLLADGTFYVPHRIAGMGNACIFPLQCIIFGTVVMLANYLGSAGLDVVEYISGRDQVHPDRIYVKKYDCVYGDDIIVHANQAEATMSLLTALGFIVNEDKSFYGSRVLRESCGVYGLGRGDVTPLRFRGKGLVSSKYEAVTGLIDLTNQAFRRGYFNLRQMLLDHIPRWRYAIIPEDSPWEGPFYIIDFSADNTALKSRVGAPPVRIGAPPLKGEPDTRHVMYDTGSCQQYVKVLQPVTLVDVPSDWRVQQYLYHKWLHTPSLSEGRKPSIGDTAKTVLRWVWMPA